MVKTNGTQAQVQQERRFLSELTIKSPLVPSSLLHMANYALKVQAQFDQYLQNHFETASAETTQISTDATAIPTKANNVPELDTVASDVPDTDVEDWASEDEDEDWYDEFVLAQRTETTKEPMDDAASHRVPEHQTIQYLRPEVMGA
eukprot:gnl/MRDRNA2_/MRDRNA2_59835_c0_seq1.p2 gnl/MRDRNA2_/MRDRNA2_59835_c0~~gnl/MRDRNA2_/MRDRNA2_59835_c0_seq1.p2  ORF type:complete len:147 (+),score=32.77 gnl/MRDRNA2_/MRDRNA2_59835_c0_seq1:94-534(+)